MSNPILNANNPQLQSSQLYLQAAGSNGSDQSTSGNHLRWAMLNSLEDTFPIASRPVRVYRAVYKNLYNAIVDFSQQPDTIIDTGADRLWVYQTAVPLPKDTANTTTVVIRFLETGEYDQLAAQLGTGFVPADLLNQYQGIFKVWASQQMSFEFGFKFGTSERSIIKAEAISKHPDQDAAKRFLSFRGQIYGNLTLAAANEGPKEKSRQQSKSELAEEERAVALGTGFPTGFFGVRVEYIDYIRCQRVGDTKLEQLFLTTYVDTLQGDYDWELIDTAFLSQNGVGRLNNEQWRKYNDYNNGSPSYSPTIDMSNYQDRWNNEGLASAVTDYLNGNLSSPPQVVSNDGTDDTEPVSFLYTDLFKTVSVDFHMARMLALGYIDASAVYNRYLYAIQYDHNGGQHFSLSLPTVLFDYRYPTPPRIELGYGIELNAGECNPSIDDQGYAKFEDARYINIRREAFQYEKGVPPFFENSDFYIYTTSAIQFGLRYQNKTTSSSSYTLMTLLDQLKDSNYNDLSGEAEEMAILDNGEFTSPVYLHRTTDPDYHHYGLYSLNWFSRTENFYPGSLSNLVHSDKTVFPSRCGIVVPPTDCSAQVIFKEIPPILTTSTEQAMLNPDGSNLVVRVKYRWRPPIDGTSPPDGLAFETPDKIEFYFRELPARIIHGIIAGVTEQDCGTADLTLTISNGESLSNAFIGSVLVANEQPYVVKAINGSVVSVEGIPDNGVIVPTGSDETYVSPDYILPSAGELFVLTENLSVPAAWTQLGHRETLSTAAQQGITQNAALSQVPPAAGSGTNNSGIYDIVFTGLPNSSNNFGGSVEINGQGYTVLDTDYDNAGHLHLMVLDGDYDPAQDGSYVPWAGPLSVTYFPGTKLYLDDTSGLQFSVVYPAAGDVSKITYMGLRAVNSSTGCTSPITPPIPMVAVAYQAPVQPAATRLLEYATRPDFYGKSSYTFQVEFPNTPYAVVFYRADGKSILERLYTTSLLNNILANNSLDFIITNLDILVNGNPANSQLPPPDNINSGQSIQDAIRETVSNNFVPLTKTPVLYDQINSTVASPKPPSANTPYPMVVKVGSDLQFTDFTLDGANNSVVFYCAVGMNNQLALSAPSEIIGPIRLINSYPPKPAAIKKIVTTLPDNLLGTPASVGFEINPYVESEQIRQYKIYRTENPVDALSIHSMQLVQTIQEGQPITDDFSSSTFVPFGEPLFYRVVALREILDENNQPEFVPSFPSELAVASIIDLVNPDAPALSYTGTDVLNGSSVVTEIQSVTISWDKTVHNGKYYLYKLNRFGNWQKIHELQSNDLNLSVALVNTSLANGTLIKLDADGNTLFHHFKVIAENSSGMQSLDERRLTI
ncbi:MAG: hypothetical protein AAGG75_19530 [Bacteroidota bacterium]